ncbi:MAG: YybH family protein [Candidatus Acidiferrales bacterium]
MRLARASRVSAVAALLLFTSVLVLADKLRNLRPGDAAAIRAVLERYRTAWLSNDASGVRGAFTNDAVLIPHHGLLPIVGMAAINEFWWPASSTKTTITKFTQTTDEIGGQGSFAYVRGRSEVAWTQEDSNGMQKWRTGGNYLALLAKQSDRHWRITHLIWDDPPNQRFE